MVTQRNTIVNNSTVSGELHAGAVLRQIQNGVHDSLARILHPVACLAENLPAFSGSILELSFDSRSHPVDFAVRINRHFDHFLIEGLNGSFPIEPHTLFDVGVENIWVEYDAPFNNQPSLFFDIGRNELAPHKVYDSFLKIISFYRIAGSKNILPVLEMIQDVGAQVVYCGLMLSRPFSPVRLTINGIMPKEVSAVLSILGWQGNYAALEEIERMFLHDRQKIVLAIDITDRVQNRIGIEILDDNNEKLANLFHRQSLINVQQLNWLKDWEEVRHMPDEISDGLSRQHGRCIRELHTRINHFKFVLDNPARVLLKTYLYYCF